MKTKMNLAAFVLVLSNLNFHLSTARAQGSLAPPGPPGATMLTLSQVEPRTPIASAPFTITQPGSYYLTTNLTVSSGNAITIAASGVTLDLSGFTISSTAASATGYGIFINTSSGILRNITIANGFIQGGVTNNGSGVYTGSGFGYGVYYSGVPPANVLVSRVSVSGCLYDGIVLSSGYSTVVESCTVQTVGSYGIWASIVKQSSAFDCGLQAIYGLQVSDCLGQTSGSGGSGVYAYTALNCSGSSSSSGLGVAAFTALNCSGSSSSGTAVSADTAENCYGYSSGNGSGVYAADAALNCRGYSSSGYGVYASGIALNCSGYSSNSFGVYAGSAENCSGYSNSSTGISAPNALNCFGYGNGSGDGIYASYIANGCIGYSSSGTGVDAFIASVCHGETSTGTAISTSHNVNSY
ncbi:MAG TPA: hypothetical protein VMU04_10965 [Candidatus Acidoferrum sp.]|nr:hypothetical protein [Candidatus Acidoferrum sp.]